MNLYLIGYRGTGKTTVARLLAGKLGRPWCDADALLEEKAGRSIRQIFTEEGEAGFRERESAVLREVADQEWIIATGGGIILREENRRVLKTGQVVWLTAPADVLWERLQQDRSTAERRPNLMQGGLDEIEEMLRVRLPWYQACADVEVATDERTPDEVADLVLDWLRHKKETDV